MRDFGCPKCQDTGINPSALTPDDPRFDIFCTCITGEIKFREIYRIITTLDEKLRGVTLTRSNA